MLVLLMASMPNATPARLAEIRWCMLTVALVGLGSLGGSVWAIASDRAWLAAGIGFAPVVFCIALFVFLLSTGR